MNDIQLAITFGLLAASTVLLIILRLAKAQPSYLALSWLLLLALGNVLFLQLIRMLTLQPDDRSGNGNPAILLWLPMVILAFVLCACISRAIIRWTKPTRRASTVVSIVGAALSAGSAWGQILFAKSLLRKLAEIKHVTPQHLNTLYFNYWTLLICVGLTLAGSGIWLHRKLGSQRRASGI
ncbi:hypothetical protein COLU111180_14980 [Cohnella lubricantis]